jgi:hypothetical protein
LERWDNTGDELDHYVWTYERDETEWARSVEQVKDDGVDGSEDNSWSLSYSVDTWPWSQEGIYDEGMDGTDDAYDTTEYTCED